MNLEMFRKVIDAFRKDSNLHLRRTGITLMAFELPNQFLLLFQRNGHNASLHFLLNLPSAQLDAGVSSNQAEGKKLIIR